MLALIAETPMRNDEGWAEKPQGTEFSAEQKRINPAAAKSGVLRAQVKVRRAVTKNPVNSGVYASLRMNGESVVTLV